ncbi:AIPR family protein [Rothia sp. P4278]|uniref:AIPR family protein n=1 Tax=Rothia sp. P4278 TaxID=3402658 RepID=UPI003AEB588D
MSDKKLPDDKKAEFGFYFLSLSQFIDIDNPEELLEFITDGEFNKNVLDCEQFDDKGVDALWVDEESKVVHIFNLKHVTKSKHGSVPINAIKNTIAFAHHLRNGSDFVDPNKSEELGNQIMELMSNDSYDIQINFITNAHRERISPEFREKKLLEREKQERDLKDLEQSNDVTITTHFLNDLASYIYDSGEKIDAQVNLPKGSVLKHSISPMSSKLSYLASIHLDEIIRITCNDPMLRENTNDVNIIESDIDISIASNILFDNVRGYLGPKNQFNKNMLKVLSSDPEYFFYFNNGITIVVDRAELKEMRNQDKLILEGVQVVNGGQTLKTIYRYLDGNEKLSNLREAQVLVRVLLASGEMKYQVAEYTNSQSKINDADLKSIDKIQRSIEELLSSENINYIRKRGEISSKRGNGSLSKETMAQIIYSIKGYPYAVSNAKRKLFTDYYDSIFNSDLTGGSIVSYAKTYFSILDEYKSDPVKKLSIKKSQQKVFYILALTLGPNQQSGSIRSKIIKLENAINSYKKEESLSNSRKLYQKEFLQFIVDNYSSLSDDSISSERSGFIKSENAPSDLVRPVEKLITETQILNLKYKRQKELSQWSVIYMDSRVGFLRYNKVQGDWSLNLGVTSKTIDDFDYEKHFHDLKNAGLNVSLKKTDYENIQLFGLTDDITLTQQSAIEKVILEINKIRNNR